MKQASLQEDCNNTRFLYELVISRIDKFRNDLEEYGGVHIGYTREFFDDITEITNEKR